MTLKEEKMMTKKLLKQPNNNFALITDDIKLFAARVANILECDVYLVGSALNTPSPRDIDICAVLPIPKFEKIFGSIPQYLSESETGLWTKDCKQKWANKCKYFYGMSSAIKIKNLDFQICYEGQYNEPKFLLAKFQTLNK